MRTQKIAVFFILSVLTAETHAVIRNSVTRSLSKISTRLSSFGKNVQSKVTKITDFLDSEKGSEIVDTVSSSIETIGGAVEGLTSSDVLSIVGSSMEMISTITTLIPVVGPLVSAVFSLIGSIFGCLGGTEDIGSIVKRVIEEALHNYDESELRAETVGTMRVYRISQAYLNSVENKQMNEHEVAALASNVPVHSGVKFLGFLSHKIKENSEEKKKTQVLRAAEYTQLYVILAAMRTAILWEMYSVVRQAPNSDWTASAIKRVAEAEQLHDKDFLQFLAKPVYSNAVFFSYFRISDWPVTKNFICRLGIHFVPYFGTKQYLFRNDAYKNNRFLAFESGDVVVYYKVTSNSKFYLDPISAQNNVYYIRSAKYPDEYIYMGAFALIRRGSKPGNEGKFKIIKLENGMYAISTIAYPEDFLCPGSVFFPDIFLFGGKNTLLVLGSSSKG